MALFLKLKPGYGLSDGVRHKVVRCLRNECSPRHVPDEMFQVEEIPYTLTGKKMEIPVRKILEGTPPEQAASRDAMANPKALDAFARLDLAQIARTAAS